jgi:alkaline phosphatase D
MPSYSRRQLLKLAGACAAPLWLPRSAGGQPRWTETPFQLGVASGSPTHEGVVLWTRLMGPATRSVLESVGQALTVSWELAHDEGFTRIVQRGEAQAVPALAHSVHVELRGLASDRWYFYRFISGEAISPVGRTRTFPAPGVKAARLRLAYASCQKWEDGYFSAYRHMLAEDLDVVMFLGDYIYEYPGLTSRIRVPNATSSNGWVLTLDDYRSRYANYKSEPELQAMHAACPWLMTWDDHEVQNDYAGTAPGRSGRPVADFARRRAAAYQAYYEHMPLRAAVLTRALAGLEWGAELRLYGQLAFGDLARLYLLDNRQYRDLQACTPDGKPGSGALDPESCERWNDPERSLLGRAQEAWLAQSFKQAGATSGGQAVWNVIGQQSLFGQRDFRPGPDRFFWNDGWDGYAPARSRLCKALGGNKVPNPVLLGGDVHENWVGHVKADYANPASENLGVEFCGTSVTSRSGNSAKTREWLAENPHFIFANTERKGYGVVDFTPGRLTTRLRAMDQVGDRDGRIETLASFEVQAGRPVLEPV